MRMLTLKGSIKAWLPALAVIFSGGIATAQWEPTGVNNGVTFGTGVLATGADYHSIAVDTSNGTLYAACMDLNSSYKLTVKKLEGNEWKVLGTAGFTTGAVNYVHLAISPSGVPYVMYVIFLDGGRGRKAVVRKYDGTNWVPVGVEGLSAGNNALGRMTFDKSGTPYVAYIDYSGTMNGKMTVMKFDGTAWVLVGPQGFTTGAGNSCSIAVDPQGRPVVGYGNGANSGKFTVNRFNGTSWELVGADGFTGYTALNGVMTLDKSGNPWVAFADGTRANRVTVMKYDGTQWVTVGTAGFSAGAMTTYAVYRMCSLVIDNTGNPIVMYVDGSNSNKATAMRFNGTDWVLLGNAAFSGGTNAVQCTELLRYRNWLYAGVRELVSYQARVMQYKLCEEPETPTVAASAGKICAGSSTTLRIAGGALNDATEWSWYTGSCGGTAAGTGAALTVSPAATATYYVRATGGCVDEQACVPYVITVADKPAVPVITPQDQGLLSSSSTGNQWYLNGSAIAGAEQASYTAGVSGSYTVAVTNSDGCTSVSLPYVANVNSNLGNEAVLLLPNPLHDHVKVKFTKIVPQVVINIISLEGKIITSARFVNVSAATLDTKALQPGVYLVRVFSTDGSSQTLRMIKGN